LSVEIDLNRTLTKTQTYKNKQKARLTDDPRAPRRTYNTASVIFPRSPKSWRFIQLDDTTDVTPISGSNAATVAGSYFFILTNLSNYSSFAAIFDQYMVQAISVEIVPRFNAIAASTTSNSPMRVVIDYDDATVLASASAAEQYASCTTIEAHESCHRTFRPHLAVAAYSGAFTSYKNEPAGWIDIASATVQHYGLKWFVPISPTTTVPVWDLKVKISICFRTVR
jgi:hypothetical protein